MMPFKFGRESSERLTEVMGAMDKVKKRMLKENKAWYLNNMAVAQELRGQGVGTKLLQQQLQSIVIPSGLPAILMTQKETNVKFYQKLGFEITDESSIGQGKNAFINWCLIFKTAP